MQYKFLLFFLLLFPGMTVAQGLARKAELGIDWVNDKNGVKVVTIYDDHVSDDMGLKPGDIIMEIGGIKVQHMGALMYWFEQTDPGKNVYLTILRDGEKLYVQASKAPKPYEQDVVYDHFEIKEGRIRTLINRPKGVDSAPAILFIQDYTCHSVDMAGRDYYPIKKLAEDFAREGYVFVRVENMGLGDSQTDLHCYQIGYKQEGRVFCEALRYIKSLEYVDLERIIILAHGFGGNQVLQVIPCGKPDYIIFWGLYTRFTNEACLPMRDASYWQEVKRTENLKEWTSLDSRIIFIHPEFDEFDNEGRDALELKQYLEPKKEKPVSYEVFPEASHFFQKVTSMDNPGMTIGSYLNPEFLSLHYHNDIVPYMVDWLEKNE